MHFFSGNMQDALRRQKGLFFKVSWIFFRLLLSCTKRCVHVFTVWSSSSSFEPVVLISGQVLSSHAIVLSSRAVRCFLPGINGAGLAEWQNLLVLRPVRRYCQGRRQRGGQWCPGPHFTFGPRLLHTSNIVFEKCGPPFWFLAPPSGFWPPCC